MVPSTRITLKVTSVLLGMFHEKIWPCPDKSKNVPKTAKIEGNNTRFLEFSGARTPNATRCLLGTSEVIGKQSCGLERICGCLYVHSRQFWISREMNEWGV